MAIKVKCNNCGKTFHISDNETGEYHTCLRCGNEFYVQSGGDVVLGFIITGIIWWIKTYIEICIETYQIVRNSCNALSNWLRKNKEDKK